MQLAIFDRHRLGLVDAAAGTVIDVTAAVRDHEDDAFGAGWWVRMCRDFDMLRDRIASVARDGTRVDLDHVRLRPPVLNPTKIVACAANYSAHRAEMARRRERAGDKREGSTFDVFFKAPSSVTGHGGVVLLPAVGDGYEREVHHECELALVVGRGGKHISEADAMNHVLGYTIGLDMTLRGKGDRSRRKSYDTFCPLGPWLTTADEVHDPHDLRLRLWVDGDLRQDFSTGGLTVRLPGIISYVSSIMRLEPGDVILTGAGPGVGPVVAGNLMTAEIGGLGRIDLKVEEDAEAQG
jgi:2-keto-4-pentenoate hydratase/2-oxohepta-3-ene-1,7-dioic acid hydratase in catechol pathway